MPCKPSISKQAQFSRKQQLDFCSSGSSSKSARRMETPRRANSNRFASLFFFFFFSFLLLYNIRCTVATRERPSKMFLFLAQFLLWKRKSKNCRARYGNWMHVWQPIIATAMRIRGRSTIVHLPGICTPFICIFERIWSTRCDKPLHSYNSSSSLSNLLIRKCDIITYARICQINRNNIKLRRNEDNNDGKIN